MLDLDIPGTSSSSCSECQVRASGKSTLQIPSFLVVAALLKPGQHQSCWHSGKKPRSGCSYKPFGTDGMVGPITAGSDCSVRIAFLIVSIIRKSIAIGFGDLISCCIFFQLFLFTFVLL